VGWEADGYENSEVKQVGRSYWQLGVVGERH
jgi:hypothetical protein